MATAKKFLTKLPFHVRPGDHVHLKPFRDGKDRIPAQCGEYLGNSGSGIAMIRLCPKHREGKHDDGLREVTYDQLKRQGEGPGDTVGGKETSRLPAFK